MKKLKYRLLFALTPLLGLLLRILGRTVRWKRRYEFSKDEGVLYALWHGHALGLALFGTDRGIVALVSRFRDGELASKLLKELGFETVRGSAEEGKASKGGRSAALKLIELLKEGKNVAITVDGPKGPPFKVKKGVVYLAKKTGAPVVPVAVRFEDFWELKTWDRLVVPKPFTRGEVLVGERMYFSPEEPDGEALRRLEERLKSLSSAS